MSIRLSRAAAIVAVAGAAASASAEWEAVFASVGPRSTTPDGVATFDRFDRPVRSPDGTRWMLLARDDSASASEATFITGSGNTGTVRIREGVTDIDSGRVPEFMSDRRVAINDAGQWAVTLGLTGDSSDDEVLIKGEDNGSFAIAAREGGLNPAIGSNYGSFNYSANIDANGDLAFGWDMDGFGSGDDIHFFTDNGNTLVEQENTTDTDNPVNTSFYVADNGTDWFLEIDNPNGTDTLRKNGVDVLQEGDTLPGIAGSIADFYLPEMTSNGDWLSTGRNDDAGETGWAVMNGSVLAKSTDLVGGNVAGESWDETVWTSSSGVTFFHLSANNNGDYVVGGFTDNVDTDRNAVWMLNGTTEILRAGDQIDLDGDGALDDAFVYIASYTTASPTAVGGFLTDDLWFYATVDIRNGAGDDLGQAFIRMRVPTPGAAGLLAIAGVAGLRRRR